MTYKTGNVSLSGPESQTQLLSFMKTSFKARNPSRNSEAKPMTFGSLVEATYQACGDQQAPKILQLAMESHIIKFSRPPGMNC